jgi:hypothetical protein
MSTSKIFDKLHGLFPNKTSKTSGNLPTVLKSVEFTGSQTYIAPSTAINNTIYITLFGGGGGGGSSNCGGGAGGGGGGTKIVKYKALIARGETIAVVVGGGGTGVSSGGVNGNDGESSSVVGTYFSISAEGGKGGEACLSYVGGLGGASGLGKGIYNSVGVENSGAYFKTAGSGGTGRVSSGDGVGGESDYFGVGGTGGIGKNGGGGGGGYGGGNGGTYSAGTDGLLNSGGGGGGGNSVVAGRAGGSGYCKIEWYELT